MGLLDPISYLVTVSGSRARPFQKQIKFQFKIKILKFKWGWAGPHRTRTTTKLAMATTLKQEKSSKWKKNPYSTQIPSLTTVLKHILNRTYRLSDTVLTGHASFKALIII